MSKPVLLIVDDDPLIAESAGFFLSEDFAVLSAASRAAAIEVLRTHPQIDLALVDLGLPPKPHRPDEGFRLIGDLLAHAPDIRILVLSGQDQEISARHARALGAVDFIAKPAQPAELRTRLHTALGMPRTTTGSLIGESLPMRRLNALIRQYADAPFPVLITGESGSGKEIVAREIHHQSPRRTEKLLVLNCAAIAPTLVEATLFGHARGAFTGAQQSRAGFFEEAGNGSLFLDEIGELPLELQPKLLRVLENGEYQRIGDPTPQFSLARIITATNRDLREEVKAGRFRADLYHRLSVFTITVPPLRTLEADRLLLLKHYAKHHALEAGTPPFTLSASALERWLEYPFPGNVRELRNIILRLTVKYPAREVSADELEAEFDLIPQTAPEQHDDTAPNHNNRVKEALATLEKSGSIDLDSFLQAWEKAYLEAAQTLAKGNIAQAARMLGINRSTLYNRLEVLNRNKDL